MSFWLNPHFQLLAGILILTVLFTVLLRLILRRFSHEAAKDEPHDTRHFLRECLHASIGPVSLLVWYYGCYAMAHVAVSGEWVSASWVWIEGVLNQIAGIGFFIAVLWFFFGLARAIDRHLQAVAARSPGKLDDVLLPLLGLMARLTVPLLALLLVIQLWPLPPRGMEFARKALSIALIAAFTWVLRRAVLLAETSVLSQKELRDTTNFSGRALVTRVSVLRKIVLVLITIFAFAAVLMMFEEVRDVGRSILASAGIAGIVVGFAAQRSLGNLFAGLQIALTQPVRIGDQVKIGDEVGFVEEITLTYIVIRVWDFRRLIVPISYFIEQPVQNWTRTSSNLLSPVTIRVDFTFPVEKLREFMRPEVERSPLWDKKAFAVQVTGADQTSMELRILASAANPGDSFGLQCEIREKAIDFVHRLYPQCLPKAREEGKPIQEWRVSEELQPRKSVRIGAESAAEVEANLSADRADKRG